MPRFRWSLIALAATAVWLFSTPWLGRTILGSLEMQFPVIAVADAPNADAIVVLTGTGPPRRRPLRRNESPNRIEVGLALYRAGKAPVIVRPYVSAAQGREQKAEVVGAGVPEDHVLNLGPGVNTADEARLAVGEARRRKWSSMLLVTSGFHMGRAKLLFDREAERAGIALQVVPFPADLQNGNAGAKGLLPSVSGWEASRRAFKEIVGQLACRVGLAY